MKSRRIFELILLMLLPLGAKAEDVCGEWLARTGATPGTPDCEIQCATADVDMATFDCPSRCEEWCGKPKKEDRRMEACDKLKTFASPLRTQPNKCNSLASMIDEAVRESQGRSDRTAWVMENLKRVIIGENMTTQRSRGPCFVGHFKGSGGFKPELQDPFNQVQHAMAGIYIGYKYGWLGCLGAKLLEDEPQDIELYNATCGLGRSLGEVNLESLSDRVRKAIGDASCTGEE